MKKINGTEFTFPPAWCATICRNSMISECIEKCALLRDASEFEIKTDLVWGDLPILSEQEFWKLTPPEIDAILVAFVSTVANIVRKLPKGNSLIGKRSRRVLAAIAEEDVSRQAHRNALRRMRKIREGMAGKEEGNRIGNG